MLQIIAGVGTNLQVALVVLNPLYAALHGDMVEEKNGRS